MLRKLPKPSKELQLILMEIMDPNLVYENKKKFWLNCIYLIGVIVCLFIFTEIAIVALFGACIISFLNKNDFVKTLIKIDWKIIVFLICIFVMIESMYINGLFPILGNWISSLNVNSIFGEALIIVFISAAIASFLANSAVSLIMIGLITVLLNNSPNLQSYATVFYAAIIIGINLSNFLPQGSMAAMITINMAKTEYIPTFTYKKVLKVITLASILHLIMGIAYLWILTQLL